MDIVPGALVSGDGRPCRCICTPSPEPALLLSRCSRGGGPQLLQLCAPLYTLPAEVFGAYSLHRLRPYFMYDCTSIFGQVFHGQHSTWFPGTPPVGR